MAVENNVSSDRRLVSFLSRSYKLAARFYQPTPGSPSQHGAAVVICHPWTSIKEQSPAKYARVLSSAGFTCLTYDAAYQGAHEGEPRDLEDPNQRIEDIKAAVTYLLSRDDVDSEKIGVPGICASGGYAPFAAQRATTAALRFACANASSKALDIGYILLKLDYLEGLQTRSFKVARLLRQPPYPADEPPPAIAASARRRLLERTCEH